MKVGTDGVLIGSIAGYGLDASSIHTILDIGCGSGLLTLMLAQRFGEAKVVGVEIDSAAASQAKENVDVSPWSNRISIIHSSIQDFNDISSFDLIVSNPPYFNNSLTCPSGERSLARHTDSLPYSVLARSAADRLSASGLFCLVVPKEVEEMVCEACNSNKLFLQSKLDIKTKSNKVCKRVILTFTNRLVDNIHYSELLLMDDNGQRSKDFSEITRDFYL